MSAIGELLSKRFDGYLRRRIPHELDDVVDAAVLGYRAGSRGTREAMLKEIDSRIAGVLSVYGERMAAVAVRTQSADPLRRGLVAMGMAEGSLDDSRANLIVLAAVNHSANSIGTTLSSLIDDVAVDLSEVAIAAFRAFVNRSERDKSLQAMGLGSEGTGDSFRYVSA